MFCTLKLKIVHDKFNFINLIVIFKFKYDEYSQSHLVSICRFDLNFTPKLFFGWNQV